MSSAAVEINNCYEKFKDDVFRRNDLNTAVWTKYRSDLDVTKSLLTLISKKISHNVMIPVGPKALIRGKIVHTNEFLVNLGNTWFCKASACQATEICNRRIKTCDEMLQKLEKERQLFLSKSTLPIEEGAFGSEERPEIIEYVTEEENEEWNKQHRIREKECRLQSAGRTTKVPIETEEDLWKRLDELELQEELEDELNRLDAESSSEEEVLFEEDVEQNVYHDKPPNKGISKKILSENKTHSKVKKKVVFADSLDSSEPLRLEITHSNIKPNLCNLDSEYINSPRDIFEKYLLLKNKSSLSILTNSDKNFDSQKKLKLSESTKEYTEDYLDAPQPITTGLNFNDVFEKNPSTCKAIDNVGMKSKKISKFKALRMTE